MKKQDESNLDAAGQTKADDWAKEIDRKTVSDHKWTPAALRGRWTEYCRERDETKPPQPVTLSGFALSLGLSAATLDVFENRSPELAHTVRRIRLDCFSRVEERLLAGKGSTVGAIFWLKNKAGWRDKTPEETKDDREDWLARAQANAAAAERKTGATYRLGELPSPHDPVDEFPPDDEAGGN